MNASNISDGSLLRLGSALQLQRGGIGPRRLPERTVCIIPLSTSVPTRSITSAFSAALGAETKETILLIQLGREKSAVTGVNLVHLGEGCSSDFQLAQYLENLGEDYMGLRVQVSGSPRDSEMLDGLLQHCARSFGHVVIEVGHELPLPIVLECIKRTDVTYLLVRATSSDFYQRDLLQKQALSEVDGVSILRTIVCREETEAAPNSFVREAGTKIHGCIYGCSTPPASSSMWTNRDFQSDIRRWVREVSRRRVGLALSSGGARGLAHIGVIQVLEENGIEIDVIAGCSMGSYVGAVWAFGYDGTRMERLAREVEHPWGLLELIDPFLLPRQGFLRGEKVKKRLKRTIGDIHFAELRRPLRIVATHLATLSRIIFASGEVAQVVHASSAIPGACVPVTVGEELYLDGGIADPLPVDVLEEMGVERIIAVNTIPTPEYLRSRLEMEKERALRLGRRASRLKSFVNRYINYFAPGNVLDIILRSFNGAQMQVAEHSCRSADVVLRPLLHDGRWHDFRRPGKYIAVGRRETEQHLDAIKCLVNGRNLKYEAQSAQREMGTTA